MARQRYRQRTWHLLQASLLSVSLLFCSAAKTLRAESPQAALKAPFSYADLLRLRSVGAVKISPDGKWIAYTLNAVDPQRDQHVETLWLLRTSDRQTTQISLAQPGAFSWAPDSGHLAVVHQAPDGKIALSLLLPAGLHSVHEFPLPSAPGDLIWSPNGKAVAFSLRLPAVETPSFLDQAIEAVETALGEPADAKRAPLVQVTQAAQYRLDGGRWPVPGHDHLFVLSMDSGRLQQVGSGPYDDRDPSWTADGSALIFTSDHLPTRDRNLRRPALFRTDLKGGAVQQLTPPGDVYQSPVVSPDGKWIAYTEYSGRRANYTRSDLFVMRLDGSSPHRLAAQLDRDLGSLHWSDDSKALYAQYDDHGIPQIALFSLDGSTRKVASGMIESWTVARDGSIAYAESSPTHPAELAMQPKSGSPVTLTSSNDFLQQRELGHLVHLATRSSADGVPVEGWALLPAGSSGHGRLPTIVSLHGGPFGDDGPDWSSARELYAAAGFAVIYVNYRGSISYGSAFAEPANQHFPGVAYKDVISIVDQAVHEGIADPERLFIRGGSAGGELTSWVVGKTKQFRAAVAEKPVINNVSEALVTDQYLAAPTMAARMPWEQEREQELWADSPLSLAGSITTPLLFITGEEDYRTPLDQSLQLYSALKLQGVPSALMRVPGAGHESLSSRPSQLAAEVAATLAWFRRYDGRRQGS